MYSYNDFEHFWVCYKLRGIPAGVSIEKFYMSNQVPYNLFAKWYKNTRKQIIPVLVLGALPPELEIQEIPSPILERNLAVDTWLSSHTELLILVDIRMSNGVHISQKNLSYESQFYLSNGDHIQQCYLSHVGLKLLVQKLKVLCRAWPN